MDIGFHCGTCLEPNSSVSTTSFIEGRGGKTYVFTAMYSLRMSLCIVPRSCSHGTPCFSATTRYMDQRTVAGALVVMEVLILSSGIPSKSTSISARESMATPHLPTSPADIGWSESYPINVGR